MFHNLISGMENGIEFEITGLGYDSVVENMSNMFFGHGLPLKYYSKRKKEEQL